MNTSPEWVLIYLGLLAICLELLLGVSTGFDMVVVGSALIIGGAIGVVAESWKIGLAVSLITTLGYVMLGRKLLRKSLTITTSATNVDRLIGKIAQVTKAITPNRAGQVNLEGEIWRATSKSPVRKGQDVEVQSVEGVTLLVSDTGAPGSGIAPEKSKTRRSPVTKKSRISARKPNVS